MKIYGRLHKLFALVMSVALVSTSLFPVLTVSATYTDKAGDSTDITTNVAPEWLDAISTEAMDGQAPESSPLLMPNLQSGSGELATASPLSVSRIQSAYAASGLVSNTLVVTLTVKNNLPPLQLPDLDPNATLTDTLQILAEVNYDADPNTLHNVILTDELLPDAAFVSASRPSDQSDNSHVWQLGDLPPFGSKQVVLTLMVPSSVADFTFLDTGAAAWGSWQNQSLNGMAGPITLAPDGFEGWLNCTIDANCNDTYVIEQAAALGNDPLAIFAYVRGLSFESYLGSLRGARGTLWNEAGNSVDQSNLLIAMLRASGIPASYRQGTLTAAAQEQLILSMFPSLSGISGHVAPDAFVATPLEDEQLLAETLNHWWVEAYLPGSGWTQLDPSFNTAEPGDVFAATIDPTRLAEVPDTLRHKVTVRLRVEDYHPLNIGGSVPGLDNSYPLNVTFNAVELIGEPVSIGHFVNSSAAGGLIFSTTQHTYNPYLVYGPNDEVIEGNAYQELITNFPLGTTLLTGAWLEFELQLPDGSIETYEREIFDKIGFEARQGGGSVQFAAGSEGSAPAISDQSIYSTLFAPGTIIPDAINADYQEMVAAMTNGQETINRVDEILASGNPTPANLPELQAAQRELAQITRLSQRIHLLNYAAASDFGLERLSQTYLIKGYYDKPRILSIAWEQDVQEDRNVIQFDLRQNDVRAVAYPGQSWTALQAFNFDRGITEATLEGQLLEGLGADAPVVSVYHVFEAAAAADIPLITVTPANVDILGGLDISDEAKARIADEMLNEDMGKIVIVPSQMVTIGGTETIGWYLIDVINGVTIDVMEDGQHTALIEYVGILKSGLQEYAFAIIGFFHGFAVYTFGFMGSILEQAPFTTAELTAVWKKAHADAAALAESIAEALDLIVTLAGDCFEGTPTGDALGWIDAYVNGAGYTLEIAIDIGEAWDALDDFDDAVDLPGFVDCIGIPAGDNVTFNDLDDATVTVPLLVVGGFTNGLNFARTVIGGPVDPPVPQGFYSITSANFGEATTVETVVSSVATIPGGPVSGNLTTSHLILSGDLDSQSTLTAANTFEFTSLSGSSATLLDENGVVLGSGSVSAVPLSGNALATTASPVAAAVNSGSGSISFHAPALSGLASGTFWPEYSAELSSGGTYSLTLTNSLVTLNGGDVYSGNLTLVAAADITLSGVGTTAAPNFTASNTIQLSSGAVNLGPSTGTLDIGGFTADPSHGVALTNFSGAIIITEVSTDTDAVSLSGSGDYFTLSTMPISSTVLPEAPAIFQAAINTTYSDSYTVTVSVPVGWEVQLSTSGQVSVTAPIGTTPGDYPIFVSAQSQQYSGLFATAVHTITTLPVQGLELTIVPEPLITVGLGEPEGISPNNTNNGQIQLPDAAFSVVLTNTSTVSHTFEVQLSGLPANWAIFAGSADQSNTAVTIEAGGSTRVGLYISPTLPLPAAGTPFNFSVTASDLDGAGLSQNASATFIVPAVPFAYLQTTPRQVFAAPGTNASTNLSLTNVGNAAASFPVTTTLPANWSINGLASPVNVVSGATVTQTPQISVPASAIIGQEYPVYFDTRAPGSEYRQRASVNVEIVSANVLPIFAAAATVANVCTIAGSELSLPVTLTALATAMNELEKSCQSGSCDLNLRDRTVDAVYDLAEEAGQVSSLLTSIPVLEQIAAAMSGYSSNFDLLASNTALRDVVLVLEGEVCAVSRYDVSAAFTPGTAAILDNGSTMSYTLHLENHGSLTTTAALTLSLPVQLSGSWVNQSYVLAPGEILSIPTTITPTFLGLFTFSADLTTAESPLIQRQATASLNVVDAFVRILNVRTNPDFVETGVSSTTLSIDVANVANLFQPALAHTEIISPDGSVQYTADVPLNIVTGSPRTYTLSAVDTSGWAAGLYTVMVELQDASGAQIPYGNGLGYLAVGQAVRAVSQVEPNIVAPGDAVVTTIIDTERTDTISSTVPSLVATIPTAVNPGETFSVTVTLYDSLGAVATDFSGIVELTSSDGRSNFPIKHRFIPQTDQGTFTFTGLAMGTAGTQTITANAGFASDNQVVTVHDTIFIGQNTTWNLEEIALTSLTISSGATLSLIGATTITADTITISNGATLSADGAGYAGNSGPGVPGPRGNTGVAASGGGYGGFGGTGSGSAAPGGSPYGSPYQPTDLGSGGGTGDGAGGAGGGAIHLIVSNNAAIEGLISVNGSNGSATSQDGAGGGSGGSIWIESPIVSGAGTIRANGGAGGNTSQDGGGGSGGRIAVHSLNNTFSGIYQAVGGFGAQYGGAGTVYLTNGTSAGELRINNNGISGASAGLPSGNYEFDTITLTGEGDLTVLGISSIVTLTNSNLTGDGSGRLIVPGTIVAPAAFIINGVSLVVQGRLSGPADITTTGSGGLELYASTPWHSGVYSFNSLTVGANTTVLARPFVSNDGDDSNDYGLQLQLTNLTIESGGIIQANGLGYSGDNGPGAPGPRGSTGAAASGAGYGGFGGNGSGSASPGGGPYDNPYMPAALGSGGGTGDGPGGNGGGSIHLFVSGSATINGLIAANGNNGSATSLDGAGGGSGGAILIESPIVSGTGTIQTNGGAGGNTSQDGGGGSGGRIAIHSVNNTFSGLYQAAGGFGAQYGGAGTIYLTDGLNAGQLRISNNGNNGASAGLLPGSYEFDTITLTGEGDLTVLDVSSVVTLTNSSITGDGSGRLVVPGTIVAPTAFTINGVTVVVQGRLSGPTDITTSGSGGLDLDASTPWHSGIYTFTSLTVGANTTVIARSYVTNNGNPADDWGIELRINNLIVETGGIIQANGLGYAGDNGPGAPGPRGSTGAAASGAGYGGFGGNGSGSVSPGGSPYGNPYLPTNLGSGGGAGDGPGGSGGGAIHIVVTNNLVLDGLISANGSSGSATSLDGAGGGSGGSIFIDALTLNGTGTIQANGGAGGNTSRDGGGGSGGRIAIHSANNSFSGSYQAFGGFGAQYGGAGTVYLTNGLSSGQLLISNNGNNGASAALLSGNYEFDTITLSAQGDLTVIGTSSIITLTNSNITGDGSGRLVVPGTIVAPATFNINGIMVVIQGRLSGPTNITTSGSGGLDLYASTPWHSSIYTFTSLTVGANTTVIAQPYVTNNGNNSDDFGLELRLDNLVVQSGGIIQANSLGYAGDNGPGAPGPRGSTSAAASGGGYGGFGGTGSGSASPGGTPYGDHLQPTALGSGGGTGDGPGGTGGGAIHLVVTNSLVLDGLISTNGGGGSATSLDGAGGGSGGSILIESPAVSGVGMLQANGGAGGNTSRIGGGGSGGRIAIHSASNTFSGTYQAAGGFGSQYGGAGTVYLTDGLSNGTLLISNGGNNGEAAALLSGSYQFDNITLTDQGDLTIIGSASVITLTNSNITGDGSGRLVVPGTIAAPTDFTINGITLVVQGRLNGPANITTSGSGGLDLSAQTPWHSSVYLFNSLTVGANTTVIARAYVTNNGDDSDDYGIELRLNELTIEAGGVIQANGLGYIGNNGPGAPGPRGSTNAAASGAGYGGLGGTGSGSTSPGGNSYGDPIQPTDLGSGGGTGDGPGGNGGGAIHIVVANSLVINGLISANGSNGSATSLDGAGGGSGGSIWIETDVISGTGTIQANGGAGGNTADDGGGGAGGRIALHSNNAFNGLLQVSGGSGFNAGQSGTIYTDAFIVPAAAVHVTPLAVVADGTSTISVTVSSLVSGTVVALHVSPQTGVFINGQPANNYTLIGMAGAAGSVSAILTSTTTGEKVITAQLVGQDSLLTTGSVIFIPGTVNAAASTVTTDKTTIIANDNDTATITATLYDSYGHPVPGKTVEIQSSGSGVTISQPDMVTDALGRVEAVIRSGTVQNVIVTAINQSDNITLTQSVNIALTLGPVNATLSNITINPTTILADNLATATITATLRDAQNRPLANRTVELLVSGSENIIAPTVQQQTSSNGIVTFTLASGSVETKTLSIRDVLHNVTIPAGTVVFVAGPADVNTSTVLTDNTTPLANGVATAVVTARLTDASGNPLPGRSVLIQTNGSAGLILNQPFTITDESGEVRATLQSTTIQTVMVSAYDQSDDLTLTQTVEIAFVVGPANLANTALNISPSTVLADGISTATITATLVDAAGHPLANRPVELLVGGNANFILPAVATNTNSNGEVTFTLSSPWAQVKPLAIRDVAYNVTLPLGTINFASTQSSGIVRHEEYNGSIAYNGQPLISAPGSWQFVNENDLSAGYAARSRTAGDSITFNFTGSWLNLGFLSCRSCGLAEIFIDGISQGIVDTHHNQTDVTAVTYSGLSAGSHNLTINILGTHAIGSTGDWVHLDYIDSWDGTTLPDGVFEHNNPVVYFSNDWNVSVNAAAANGSYVRDGSNAWFHFTGDTVTVQPLTFNGAGWIEILIDNNSEGIFNLNNSTTTSRSISFDSLGSGAHVLQVKTNQGIATADAFVTPGSAPFHQTYTISLTPPATTGSGLTGDTVSYNLTLTNTGSKTDSYTIAATGNDWATSVPTTIGPLTPGQSAIIPVSVEIPLGIPAGANDAMTLSVISTADPTVSDVTVVSTYAVQVDVQLCITLDGSGSIGANEFALMVNGLAAAIRDPNAVAADGSIEISISQFGGSSARTELAPIVIVDEVTRENVALQIEAITQMGGGTPTFAGIDQCRVLITGSENFIDAEKQVINIATDGEPTGGSPNPETAAVNSRIAAVAAGIDEVNAEAVGVTTNGINFLRDQLVYPQPGYTAPPYLEGRGGFIVIINSFNDFATSIREKLEFVVQVGYSIDVTHTVPVTAVNILTSTIMPLPQQFITSTNQTNISWSYFLSIDEPFQRLQFDALLPDMQPGEVRQVAEGTIITYNLPSGQNQIGLPPLFVAAAHLISISPPTQTVPLNSLAIFNVVLENPETTPLTLTLTVAGLPSDWVDFPAEVTLAAGEVLTIPLEVQPEDNTGLFPFSVIAQTHTDGQDQAGATLQVTEPVLDVAVSPKIGFANQAIPYVDYTITISNLETITRTYNLTVTGLDNSPYTLTPTVTVGPNNAITTTLTYTSHESVGPHSFEVTAVFTPTGAIASDDAVLFMLGERQVQAALNPPTASGGPGVPVTYTLTITNSGELADEYGFIVTLPTGWSYTLQANGQDISNLPLRPHLFNSANLILTVTPAPGTTPGNYDVTVTVQSVENPAVTAAVSAALTVLNRGVDIEITPGGTTLSPTASGIWNVEVTNLGQVADTFDLYAGGIVASSGEFSQDTVALAPGASTTVQLTADELEFALAGSFPVEAIAVSSNDSHIYDKDAANVTFAGYEAVSVRWVPVSQTITDTNMAVYMLVISNTGNLNTFYDLSIIAPGLQSQLSQGTVFIPPHLATAVLVTIDASSAGTFIITGQADSQNGSATDSANATLIVLPSAVSEAPTAVDDDVTISEDTPIEVNVLANDFDPDGDPLVVISVTQPVSGSTIINPDNTITYTPPSEFSGVISFTYTIADLYSDTDSAVVTVTVTPVNDPPYAVDDQGTTLEDTPLTVDVLTNDSDIEGEALTVIAVTQPANGAVVINVNNTITYTPTQDYNSTDSPSGVDSFMYTIRDAGGATGMAQVEITVIPVNDPPEAQNDSSTTSEDTPVVVSVLGNDSDVDGDPLIVTTVTQPANGAAAINTDNTVTYTPTLNFNGSDSFSYTINDGNGETDTAVVTVLVTPLNDPPTAINDSVVIDEDAAATINVLANDNDIDGNPLTVTNVTAPANGTVTINPNNSVTYTPTLNFNGSDSFSYTISDGQGGEDTAIVSITVNPVNDPPIAADDAISTGEDAPVTIDVLANDNDIDGDSLAVIHVTQPAHGAVVINGNYSITYTPTANFEGVVSFVYTVSDGNGGTDTAIVTITVTSENDNPIAVDDSAVTNEDTPSTVNILANDSDVDGNALTVTHVTAPVNGTVVINLDNTVTYTPTANFYGSDSFVYTLSDDQGGSDTATVTITVNPINDAPVAANDNAVTNEDLPVTINVLANDGDVDNDTLTVSDVTQPANGMVIINSDGTVTYTPDNNYHGPDTFSYIVSDGEGGTDTATVSITINPVNDAPAAANDSVMTDEDLAVTIDILTNDNDVDGDTLTVTVVTTPTNGTAVLNPDNSVTYTPNPNYNGADSFSYTIVDGNGGSDTANVTIAINPVNDAPTAIDDTAVTNEDSAITVNVLGNDFDVDGDTLMVESVTPPANGTVTITSDFTVIYTPTANFNGSDSFTYSIGDGTGGMDTATVTITVVSVNDAPTAVDDAVSTPEDTAITIAILANDSDVDGDSLVVTNVTNPANGTVTIRVDNTITYTPTADFEGVDSFVYTISDGSGGMDTAQVTITVNSENDNPVAVDDAVMVNEDSAVTVSILNNDFDVDGDILIVAAITIPTNGTAIINPDNTVTYTPNPNYNGADSFVYTVSDGQGGSETAVVMITVASVNDAPVAVDDSGTTNQGTAVTLDILANDSDIDGDTLSVNSVSNPPNGSVVIHTNDTVTYTPDPGFFGVDTFSYIVSDGNGGTDSAVVTIQVLPVAAACNLYPIALSQALLAGVEPGDILSNIMNGGQPGNFGWLTWNGNNSVPALIASLTPPGNSHLYINPNNPNDHILNIGDWVQGKPGVSNAKGVRDALDLLIGMEIVVPVWEITAGNGANAQYHISGFATVKLLTYNLPGQDMITAQFLGYASCSSG